MKIEGFHKSFSIRIFLADGSPSGLKFVEKSNWTGIGVVCPRPRLSSAKDQKEFDRAAVYVLLGPSDTSDIPLVYIREGDPVRTRLEDHHSKKDFWTTAFFSHYSPNRFDCSEQVRVAEIFRKLSNRGCMVMLSNSYQKKILNLFEGYNIFRLKTVRWLGSNGDRFKVYKALVTNYPINQEKE